ncbi:MAG: arginine deiminase-related protein [Acidobacteriota bacterium]|nr:arginine deiminase-related protein [Acidobacteriota bacterium]
MRIALTRAVSAGIGRCELTHLERRPIDVERARHQHRRYEECLRDLGCRVQRLPEEPELPDSVFVEDIAVVLDELAVITRPGARSRRGERRSIAAALEPYRPLRRIRAPGVLDGGDVLALGRDIYLGLSTRSNRDAAGQLHAAVAGCGYTVTEVEFRGCLHLKSAVTRVGEDTLLVNPEWVDAGVFRGLRCVAVDQREPMAANALRVGTTVLVGAEYPSTGERLVAQGIEVRPIDASELAKAEGGLTCCSLVFEAGEVDGCT